MENTEIISRENKIPTDIIKGVLDDDDRPSILRPDEYENPVQISRPINTAGAEDSPFIPADRNELYFFFTLM